MYEDARIWIYIHFYIKMDIETQAYKEFGSMVARGHNVLLIGQDGRSFTSLEDELVLCALLKGETRIWETPTIDA